MGNAIDMTGWIMKEHGIPDSRITVIDRAPNKGKHVYWNCRCECGNKLQIRGDQIRSGIAKSCGCYQRDKAKILMSSIGKSNKGKVSSLRDDLTGKIFNYLIVLNLYGKNSNHLIWNCKCVCGKEIQVSADHLRSGHTKSCGCMTNKIISESKIIDYSNQKIGKLLILDKVGIKNHSMYWKCKCDCGNYCVVSSKYLSQSKFPSCGCNKSIGESIIKNILDKLKYNYKKEYIFPDLEDLNNLRFDFAIFKNNKLFCLIEYQGEQHYSDTSRGLWQSPNKHDEMKRQYCKNNNIKLIEIPYYDFSKLNENYLKELIEK